MTHVLRKTENHVQILTLNRVEKNNAFDDVLLMELRDALDEAENNESIRVILLNANGKHFSAGADLAWMQKMVHFSEEQNLEDAKLLADVLYRLYSCSKITLAAVQGCAFGGGAGLVAACDFAISSNNAQFCFSEVKLGLIPAVISPYVIQAIGARETTFLFTSAIPFTAQKACALNLIQERVSDNQLQEEALTLAEKIASNAPLAVSEAKALVRTMHHQPINEALNQKTAAFIAKKRVSEEAQKGLGAFLNKQTPFWD